MNKKISRAFISVSDKTGLIQLAKKLVEQEVEIIASDGTAAHLKAAGIATKSVERVTGFAQVLDGRVKTLHPNIHAAILADLDQSSHLADLKTLGIVPIDLVVINFYDASKFDIGGPAAVRAGVKNSKHVALLTDPAQYPEFIEKLVQGFDQSQRDRWAKDALLKVANYDLAILNKLGQPLRYGENPHQKAVMVGNKLIAGAQILSGKEMSYNNYVDADAAWKTVNCYTEPTIAFIKHATPCGIASAPNLSKAFASSLASDPISAFGGVIAANQLVDKEVATLVIENFYEVLIAPDYSDEALKLLKSKDNLRVVQISQDQGGSLELKQILGGFLFQQPDQLDQTGDDFKNWKLVAGTDVEKSQIADLSFAWRAVKNIKSNAIVIAKNQATVGIGMGQTNRVDSVKNAISRAGNRAQGAVVASDGFFPFADSIQLLLDAGISAIVQPGGSIKDNEVIQACENANISMYLTGVRHFSH
jgi:phosphoribosylaminoimidazolecarboxamide formyltransferase/IMP cyclohydrolase